MLGCAADWPSFGWLDKRPNIPPQQKLRELLQLILDVKDVFLQSGSCETAFDCWWQCHERFQRNSAAADAVPLCSSFAMALFERALIDAVCRASNLSFFDMLRQDQLGFSPATIHPKLYNFNFVRSLPAEALSTVWVRHTVGLGDPLTSNELTEDNRIADGLPQTLEQYIKQQGICYFKIKVSGETDSNLQRLGQIWNVIAETDPKITLDGNESFDDPEQLSAFVQQLETSLPSFFERILFIEQPLPRAMTLDRTSELAVRRISLRKPLIIDEADGYVNAFSEASEIGYAGVSHKNCKGVFKSLANHALCARRTEQGEPSFLSAEDLTNMPLVSLQQDFAVVAALGLGHAERNAHHYFRGLSHLTGHEQNTALELYGDLYCEKDGNLNLNIRDGQVDVAQLQCPGLGIAELPDWQSMLPLEKWLAEL